MTDPENALIDDLLAHETRVWQALVDGDAGADAALLAPTFLGVYPSGFAGRSDHAGQLAHGPTVTRFGMDDARVMRVGGDHAMLSYLATFDRPDGATHRMYVSSLWRRAGAGWVNVFSQDTPAD